MKKLFLLLTVSIFALSLAFAPGCRKKPKEEPKKVETSKPAAEAPATAEEMKKTAVETAKKTVEEGKQAVTEAAKGTMEKGTEAVQKTVAAAGATTSKVADEGKTLFVKNCSPCHPKGGNIINPKKTLHKADREANGIKTIEDILGTVRNPGPGMTKFNKTDLPDSDVHKIGEYIINTFN